MNRIAVLAASAAVILSAGLIGATPVSAAPPNVFVGQVQHVSTDNIKVSGNGQTLSFMLVPRFDQVFSSDGKTTRQMAQIHNGDYVKVFYDQKMLGTRHADKIFLLRSSGHAMSSQKS
jgi:hypothetical protein